MINFKASTCGMWHTTKGTCINDCTYIFKAPILSNHWPLTLWHSSSYLKIVPTLTYNPYSDCQIRLQHSFWKMENSVFTLFLDKLFSLWNNALHWMNYWGLHSWKIQSNIYPWESSCSILQLPPVWYNGLHVRWDCLSKTEDFPSLEIWKSYALSW